MTLVPQAAQLHSAIDLIVNPPLFYQAPKAPPEGASRGGIDLFVNRPYHT